MSDTSKPDNGSDSEENVDSFIQVLLRAGLLKPSSEKRECGLFKDKPVSIEPIIDAIKEGNIKNIVVMAGAGISVSAGIPDFRTPGTGLYDNLQKYNLPTPESIFSIDYFRTNPEAFYTLAAEMLPGMHKPTPTHYFLRLLAEKKVLRRIFTQNIDTLEQVAGIDPSLVVEAHGSFATAHCIDCRVEVPIEAVRAACAKGAVARCSKCTSALVKPDISLPRRFFELRTTDFKAADLLLIFGTSLKVQPFASLIDDVDGGVPRVLINRELVAQSLFGPRLVFEGEGAYRDVFMRGDCDAGSWQLAALLGWTDELNALIAGTGSASGATASAATSSTATSATSASVPTASVAAPAVSSASVTATPPTSAADAAAARSRSSTTPAMPAAPAASATTTVSVSAAASATPSSDVTQSATAAPAVANL